MHTALPPHVVQKAKCMRGPAVENEVRDGLFTTTGQALLSFICQLFECGGGCGGRKVVVWSNPTDSTFDSRSNVMQVGGKQCMAYLHCAQHGRSCWKCTPLTVAQHLLSAAYGPSYVKCA